VTSKIIWLIAYRPSLITKLIDLKDEGLRSVVSNLKLRFQIIETRGL